MVLPGALLLAGVVINLSASAGVLIWRLRKKSGTEEEEAAEKRAVRFVGITFIALALYAQELLSFGDEVKVLEPLSLVKDIKKILTNALKQYSSK